MTEVSVTVPALGIEPLPVGKVVTGADGGLEVGPVAMPAGDWTIRVDALINDFESASFVVATAAPR